MPQPACQCPCVFRASLKICAKQRNSWYTRLFERRRRDNQRRTMMSNLKIFNRRELLRASAIVPVLFARPSDLLAAQYDLVIRGGRVLDASQHIDRVADVAIRDGKIAAIKPKIAPSAAKEVFDATGKLVMPGLIDIHAHLADPAMPPATCLADGVTTLVDAGSSGFENVDNLVKIVQSAPIRARILINIAHRGVEPMGELMD